MRGLPLRELASATVVATAFVLAGNAGVVATPATGVYSWGYNHFGQFANGTTTDSLNVASAGSFDGMKSISAGNSVVLALKPDGTVWAAGDNRFGELGNGSLVPLQSASLVQVPGLSSVTAVAAGWTHNLALKSDGTVWGWGANQYGQLGNGSTSTTGCQCIATPTQVSGLSGVVAISVHTWHSLALRSDGTVWAWGYNGQGQLGNQTQNDSSVPVQVNGLTNVTAIGAGFDHSLALRSDGTVWAWGDNYFAELGTIPSVDYPVLLSTTPIQVTGLSNVVSISAGAAHSVALESDGSTWGWGINDEGEVGDGTFSTNACICAGLTRVVGLGPMKAVAAGYYHTIALAGDGTVWAWGANFVGQLGDGTTTHRASPMEVPGLSGVTTIYGGFLNNFAVVAPNDTTPPDVTCDAADGAWHANDVSLACTAGDSGSGLQNPADASFTLSTSVAPGTETANASTDTRSVCDVAGNCTNAGPITGNKVDKAAPAITITSPAAAAYVLNQSVTAAYSCSDGGSGVASCTGTAPNGGALNTSSVGSQTFGVSAADNVGNASSASVVYTVGFGVCALYDQNAVMPAGSVRPIKLELCDANGTDASASAIIVHATGVVRVSTNTSNDLVAGGNANPDNDFRFDSTLGTAGGYIFNLSTKGFASGTYRLFFTATGDPGSHYVQFELR